MTDQVRVMIVEDESIVAMDLAAGLEHDGYLVTGIADNYADAVKLFSEHQVDVLLMDIHIQGEKDGVETASALMNIKQVPLIYLTAYTDATTLERVKHTRPSAFLTKPYSIENVRIAIDLALHQFAETRYPSKVVPIQRSPGTEKKQEKEQLLQLNDYIFIKQNYRFVKLHLADILFAEADSNHVILQTAQQKYSLRLSLADLIDRLRFQRLVRVHRSFAVNLDAIGSFDDQLVRIGKHEIPIGRNYRQEFFDHFNLR